MSQNSYDYVSTTSRYLQPLNSHTVVHTKLICANRVVKCSCKVILIHLSNTFAGAFEVLASILYYLMKFDAFFIVKICSGHRNYVEILIPMLFLLI